MDARLTGPGSRFNPETQIAFTLPQQAGVTLRVYNVLGELVTTLVNRRMAAGTHRVRWDGRTSDGREAASGVYFYRLQFEDRTHTGKMLMVR